MNNTLQNGFMILEYLAQEAEECSVKELAEHFRLPNSHICRLLKTLAETGYVEQTPGSRKYRISLKILNLSNARLRKLRLRTIARPGLQQLAREFRQPVYLSANYHGFSLIIGVEYPERYPGDAGLVIGNLHSVNRSACGKICAAFATPDEFSTLFDACDWSAKTPASVTDPAAFRKELETIRRQEYAVMCGELLPHVGAVGAPIFQADGALDGAVGALLPEDETRWTPELIGNYADQLRLTARSISLALGYPLENERSAP